MNDRSVTVVGLPGSGKTTYLAALWASLNERHGKTMLRFRELGKGDRTYLNTIATRWRSAQEQERTPVGSAVALHLFGKQGEPVSVIFPDLTGETFVRIWADRICTRETHGLLSASGLLLFIHSDRIARPQYIREAAMVAEMAGEPLEGSDPTPWAPELAPTQVQLVGLLDALRCEPFEPGPRRVAVVISAWDKAAGEGVSPRDYLAERMPLLAQYIRQNVADWEWRVYGVSAQGGEFDPVDETKLRAADAERLRNLATLSDRVKVVGEAGESSDLTEPLAWIIE